MTLIAFTKILSGAVWLALILLISICMVLTITILLQTKSSVTLGVSFSLYLLAHQRTDVVRPSRSLIRNRDSRWTCLFLLHCSTPSTRSLFDQLVLGWEALLRFRVPDDPTRHKRTSDGTLCAASGPLDAPSATSLRGTGRA